jgi:hypothetical protein
MPKPAAIGRICPLRHDALKAQAADVLEHGRAVARQMLGELDGAALGPAEQSGEPPLASITTMTIGDVLVDESEAVYLVTGIGFSLLPKHEEPRR